MKKIICFNLLIALVANAESQNQGRVTIGDFNAIEISSAARVNLIQSDSNYVILNSKDPVLRAPTIGVVGGILEITGTPFRGTIDVHYKNITSIKASDAVRVTCSDTMKTDNLTVRVSDASRVDILVHAKIINARVKDAGNITIDGTSDSLEIKVSDASRFKGSSLRAGSVHAVASDGSEADVWALKSIVARATDGSSIHVKGSPTLKSITASDGGSVKMDDSGDEIVPDFGSTTHSHDSSDGSGKHKKEATIDIDGFIGMGFVAGASLEGAPVMYGRSREFMVGFGKAAKIFSWNYIGADVYYKSTDFFFYQNSSKTFPDTLKHQSEKISFQNFGGLVYDRFYLGRNKTIFFDGGVYGDWTFHNKFITWDDNTPNVSSTKVTGRNIGFVYPTNYGVTFRFGYSNGLSLYFNYRLSKLFQNPASPAPAYPQLPVYVFGINLGGF